MSAKPLKHRSATAADAEQLYKWRTDPAVMQGSFSQGTFTLEAHKAWFAKALADSQRQIWIFENGDGKAVAMGRADFDGKAYLLSWIVGQDFRGKGYGNEVVAALVEKFHPTVAKIKVDNVASIKAAEKAGLRLVSEDEGVRVYGT